MYKVYGKSESVWYVKHFVFFIICTLHKLDLDRTFLSVGSVVQS